MKLIKSSGYYTLKFNNYTVSGDFNTVYDQLQAHGVDEHVIVHTLRVLWGKNHNIAILGDFNKTLICTEQNDEEEAA